MCSTVCSARLFECEWLCLCLCGVCVVYTSILFVLLVATKVKCVKCYVLYSYISKNNEEISYVNIVYASIIVYTIHTSIYIEKIKPFVTQIRIQCLMMSQGVWYDYKENRSTISD